VTGKKALKLIEAWTDLGGARIVYAARYLSEGSTDDEILYPRGTSGRRGDITPVEVPHLVNLIVAGVGCEKLTEAVAVVRMFRQMQHQGAHLALARERNDATATISKWDITPWPPHMNFGWYLENLVHRCADSEQRAEARSAIKSIVLARDCSFAHVYIVKADGVHMVEVFKPAKVDTPQPCAHGTIKSVVQGVIDGQIIGLIADLVTDNVSADRPNDTASDGGQEQGKAMPKAEPNSENGDDGFGRAEPSSVEASQRGATPANLISDTHREYGGGQGGNQLFRPSPGLSPAKGPPPMPNGDRLCHAEFPPPTFCVA
jgi:hypothetical protein